MRCNLRKKLAARPPLGVRGRSSMLSAGSAQAAPPIRPAAAPSLAARKAGSADADLQRAGALHDPAGYDETDGNPPARSRRKPPSWSTCGGLFKATAGLQSPNFTASAGGAARCTWSSVASGVLLDLAPQATYTVDPDRPAPARIGRRSPRRSPGASSRSPAKTGRSTVIAGHTYAVSIDAETSSSVAAPGCSGETSRALRQRLADGGHSGNGGNGGGKDGNGGDRGGRRQWRQRPRPTAACSLADAVERKPVGPATLKGNRLSVKAQCPAKVGAPAGSRCRAC